MFACAGIRACWDLDDLSQALIRGQESDEQAERCLAVQRSAQPRHIFGFLAAQSGSQRPKLDWDRSGGECTPTPALPAHRP